MSYLRGKFVLGLVLSILISQKCFAAENNPEREIEIPSADLRGESLKVVRYKALANSTDGHVVVFFGKDKPAFEALKSALRQAIREEIPINALILASPRPTKTFGQYKVGTPNQIKFFVAERGIGTLTNVQKDVETLPEAVLNIIRESNTKYFRAEV